MTQSWGSRCWQLGLASWLAIGGAIASSSDCATAQITPDGTLGAESSVVTPSVDINGITTDQIDGGAIRGANLFHSFLEFNVGEGQAAYFTNPAGIENILSRVTGNDPSDILGKLGVLGNANLFLLNPNGTIFGSNASLDVGGSFVATSANAIEFGNQGFFSASDANAPELLTVNPSAFFFNQIAAGSITNQSIQGLQVPAGQSLLLVGGDVSLSGGKLTAPGGRVELGGLARSGTVGLKVDDNLRLSYPEVGQRADVSLTNGASADVIAGGGGSIAVNARNLDISGGSSLLAGIGAGSGSVGTQAGNIVVNTGSLNVIGNALIGSVTFGQGNAGNVTIQASDTVSFSGSDSILLTAVDQSGVGNAGDINIQARELSLTNGAQLATGNRGQGNSGNVQVNATDSISVSGGSGLWTLTEGQGNAGNVTIQAGGTVSFDGVGDNSVLNGAGSVVGPEAVGNSGNINIRARELSLTNGAVLVSQTSGQGDAGSISVQANDSVSLANGRIYSTVQSGAVGNSGGINVTAGSLSLTNGAQLVTSTYGQGNAGNIQVNATDSVSFSGGSILQAATYGQGNAGDVTIQAGGTVSFDGLPSGAASFVGPLAVGKGGNINIQAHELSLSNGTQLATSTLGQGNAGNIQVNATDSVSFSSGSSLQTVTYRQGNAGNVTITAGGTVSFDGAGANRVLETFSTVVGSAPFLPEAIPAFAESAAFFQAFAESAAFFQGQFSAASSAVFFGNGKGGNINIQARELSLTNRAILTSSTSGQGDAGSISVQAKDSVSLANSFIDSTVEQSGVGNGSDINIQTRELSLTDGAALQASTRGRGNAGNIRVNAIDSVNLSGVGSSGASSGLFTGTSATASGQGGEIRVATGALRILDGAVLGARTRNAANGGNIFVNVNTFEAINGGQLLTTAFSSGRAGNITVDATNSVTLSGSDPTFSNRLAQFGPERVDPDGPASGLFAQSAATGTAGSLTITTGQLLVEDGAEVTVSGPEGFKTVDHISRIL